MKETLKNTLKNKGRELKLTTLGFTLIELLAVIVILAIIALIATPIILNIIEKARKEAFVDTAYGIINAAELQYTEGIMDNKVEEKFYTFPQGEDKLKFSGAEPKGGNVKISSTGKVSIAIHNGDWCVTKEENETKVTIEEYTEDCFLEPPLVYTDEECFTFDETIGKITAYDNSCPRDVVIPKKINGVTVKIIGSYAFASTDSLGAIEPENNQIQAVNSLDGTIKAQKLNTHNNNQYAFFNEELTSVVIPDTIVTIESYAFRVNYLKSIEIPSSVTSIGERAFENNSLTSLIIPSSVKTIGRQAFKYNRLTSVEIPNSITVIESDTFASNKLTSVTIPSSVTSIDTYAFYDNPLTKINISDTVERIEKNAFPESALSEYKNGDFVIINHSLVNYTGTDTEVTIPSDVVYISRNVFNNKGLTSVTISNSVTSIGASAFYDNQLTSVEIPNSVTSIGTRAFWGNPLTSVTIKGKSSVTDFESYPTESWLAPFGWASGYSDDNITWNG